MQRAPVPFLQCAIIKPVLVCAIAACSLDHREANASVMKFLDEFAKSAVDKAVWNSLYLSFIFILKMLPYKAYRFKLSYFEKITVYDARQPF